MATMHIYRGLPGCGKTFAARWMQMNYGGVMAGRDHLRDLMFNARGQKLSWEQEVRITDMQTALIREALRNGDDVYVDDMNLRNRYVRRLVEIAKSEGADYVIHDLTDVELEVCIERDSNRIHSIGADVIEDLHNRFIKGKPHPLPVSIPDDIKGMHAPYEPNEELPTAIMIDIDGTIAHHGDRDIYDLSRVYEDTPDPAVWALVRTMRNVGYRLVFCSGRNEKAREDTERWIRDCLGIHPSEFVLFMRPSERESDPDYEVKLDLFDKYIRDEYNVLFVLDDRNSVVDAWRSIGLKVFQVAPGDF